MQSNQFKANDSLFVANIIPMYFNAVKDGFETNNWTTADSIISYIQKFQIRYGFDVLPVQTKINLEITYNQLNIFSRLFMYYFSFGVLLLSVIIISLFKKNKLLHYLTHLFKWMIIFGFIAHILGLALRWYISGHAPWSNGYESMIYIAWATIFSGLIFSKRSSYFSCYIYYFWLLLMVAHLNWLDPEITNLVPVLKSYWLMIHVAIITASYGFFSLGSILGLISLWLIIFTNSHTKNKLNNSLKELTIINEKSLEIGLFMLTIGTFLGGVWANESWGRYWGWDPKETWALVSILIYTFVLHMRFVPSLRSPLTFNIASMFSIWTIIMTYFGVNYYLSGLHSYAAGDPMPIPSFVYYLSALMFLTAIISKLRFKKIINNEIRYFGFGAHPDDVELGCGGTLIKEIQNGKKVGIIDLTRGELGTRGTAKTRDEETKVATQIMGVVIRENMNFKDGFFKNNDEHKIALIKKSGEYRPEIVITNAISDRHPDHPRAAQITIDACFLSGLPKIQTGHKIWRPKSVYHYIQFNNLKPDIVVDILNRWI